MSLESIIGQPLAVDLVRRWLAKETTHPLLFYGPAGVGKKTLALAAAKVLNCASGHRGIGASETSAPRPRGSDAPTLKACQSCPSCRRIAAGQHPDVRVIDLNWQAAERDEDPAKQQNLRMETVLNERKRLGQTAVEGAWKVSIIDDAHRFTADAANVLLKILEEPPARTAIFLITPFRDRLFQTIISRCQPVRFRPLTDEEMRQVLERQGVPKDLQIRLIELALGSPARALHMNRQEQIEAVSEAEELWQWLPGRRPAEIVRQAEGKGRAARISRAEAEDRVGALLVPAVRGMRSGDPKAARAVHQLQAALTQLRQNVQPAVVLDHLLLQLSKSL